MHVYHTGYIYMYIETDMCSVHSILYSKYHMYMHYNILTNLSSYRAVSSAVCLSAPAHSAP